MSKKERFVRLFTQEQATFIADRYQDLNVYEIHELFNKTFNTNLTVQQIKSKVSQLKITKRRMQESFGLYTDEMCKWLVDTYNTAKFDDLVVAFNEKFKTDYTKSALWHKRDRLLGGQIDRTRRYLPRVDWTDELVDFLKETYDDYSYKKIAKMINEKFNVKTTESSVAHKASRLGLKKSEEGIAKSADTKTRSKFWFKKGNKPPTYLPVGSEAVKGSGYLYVKIADPDVWKPKHWLIYEKHHGAIAEDEVIIFVNSDKNDFRIENLVAISRSELAMFNTTGIKPVNDEVAQTKLAIAKIRSARYKILRKRKEKKDD